MNIEKEQNVYASVLSITTKFGMVLLGISFIIYVLSLLPPYIPINELPKYWSLSIEEYLKATGIPQGWLWVSLVKNSDFLNFIGIVFLSGITIICYLATIPIFYKKKDKLYLFLAVLQVIILLLVASGVFVVSE